MIVLASWLGLPVRVLLRALSHPVSILGPKILCLEGFVRKSVCELCLLLDDNGPNLGDVLHRQTSLEDHELGPLLADSSGCHPGLDQGEGKGQILLVELETFQLFGSCVRGCLPGIGQFLVFELDHG